MRRTGLLALTLGVLLGARAGAQAQSDLARLDPTSRATIVRIIDSTRAAGLPTTPLEWKVSEGVTKGADGARIVGAVQRSADGLRRAREALGAEVSTPELIAGAGALQVGASPDALRRLRGDRHERPLTLRLVVLSDLVSRGVPVGDATAAVLRLSSSGASDDDFSALRRDVLRDVQGGVAPARALAARARELSAPRSPAPRDSLRAPPEP